MKFKVLPRQNPSDRTAPVRYYPFPQWDSELTMRQMAQQIAAHCALPPTQTEADRTVRMLLTAWSRSMLLNLLII